MVNINIFDKWNEETEEWDVGAVYIIRWLPTETEEEEEKPIEPRKTMTYIDSFDKVIAIIKEAKKSGVSIKTELQVYSASFEEGGYALQPIDPWDLIDKLAD